MSLLLLRHHLHPQWRRGEGGGDEVEGESWVQNALPLPAIWLVLQSLSNRFLHFPFALVVTWEAVALAAQPTLSLAPSSFPGFTLLYPVPEAPSVSTSPGLTLLHL